MTTLKELFAGTDLETKYQWTKRKKESRRQWYGRYCDTQKVIDEAWNAVWEGIDAEVGSKT